MYKTRILYPIATVVVALAILFPSVTSPVQAQGQGAASSQTQLMQQSDHKRRLSEARESEVTERQMAAIAPTGEQPTRELDYIVLAVLAVSLVAMIIISKKRNKMRARPHP